MTKRQAIPATTPRMHICNGSRKTGITSLKRFSVTTGHSLVNYQDVTGKHSKLWAVSPKEKEHLEGRPVIISRFCYILQYYWNSNDALFCLHKL